MLKTLQNWVKIGIFTCKMLDGWRSFWGVSSHK